MCEFSEFLLLWLDGELGESDAARVEQHLRNCPECRDRVQTYRQLSESFEAYCDRYFEAAFAKAVDPQSTKALPVLPRWVPAVSSAAAIAAALAIIVLLAPRVGVRHLPLRVPAHPPAAGMAQPVHAERPSPADAKQAAIASAVEPAPLSGSHAAPKPIQHVAAVRGANGNAASRLAQGPLPAAPALEIAIPGDAIFPPGAFPPGISFTADVTIAPDGSAQQIRLQPQLVEFERRTNQQ